MLNSRARKVLVKTSLFFSKNEKQLVFGLFLFLSVAFSFGLGYLLGAQTANPVPIIFEKYSG